MTAASLKLAFRRRSLEGTFLPKRDVCRLDTGNASRAPTQQAQPGGRRCHDRRAEGPGLLGGLRARRERPDAQDRAYHLQLRLLVWRRRRPAHLNDPGLRQDLHGDVQEIAAVGRLTSAAKGLAALTVRTDSRQHSVTASFAIQVTSGAHEGRGVLTDWGGEMAEAPDNGTARSVVVPADRKSSAGVPMRAILGYK